MSIAKDRIIKLLETKEVVEDNGYLRYKGLDITLDIKDKTIYLAVFDTRVGENNEYRYEFDPAKVFLKEYMQIKINQIIDDLDVFLLLINDSMKKK